MSRQHPDDSAFLPTSSSSSKKSAKDPSLPSTKNGSNPFMPPFDASAPSTQRSGAPSRTLPSTTSSYPGATNQPSSRLPPTSRAQAAPKRDRKPAPPPDPSSDSEAFSDTQSEAESHTDASGENLGPEVPVEHDYDSDSDAGAFDAKKSNFERLQHIELKRTVPETEEQNMKTKKMKGFRAIPTPPIRVDMWRSKVTKFTVIKADAPGPMISASWHVQLPNKDNRGIPSALLNMIDGTGTANDPEKDFIDVLGARMMSSGLFITGSLTCGNFKMTSASADGFIEMLPPVFEKILHPNLTNEVFLSEVHHVDGNGRDGGRAYLHAQDIEFKMSRVMSEAVHDAVFSASGPLRFSPDGSASELAKLDLDAITSVHNDTFVPSAMLLVVTGPISTAKLLNALQEDVEPLLKKLVKKDWQRPFVDFDDQGRKKAINPSSGVTYWPITRAQTNKVAFAGKDGARGQVRLAWEGPFPGTDYDKIIALNILARYILYDQRDDKGAPLNPVYSSKLTGPDADCACDLAFEWSRTSPTLRIAILGGVDDNKLDTIGADFQKCLATILSKPIDLDIMESLIDHEIRTEVSELEESPKNWITATALFDWTFGKNDGQSLKSALSDLDVLKSLRDWTSAQWLALGTKYMADSGCVTIIGRPNSDIGKAAKKARSALKKANKDRYGVQGLAMLEKALDASTSAATGPVPASELQALKPPDVDSIQSIQVAVARSEGVAQSDDVVTAKKIQALIDDEKIDLPYFIQFDHVESDFVEISIVLAPQPIPRLTAPFMPFFVKGLFHLPVKRLDGTIVTPTQLKLELDDIALSWGTYYERERVVVHMKLLSNNYATAITWLRDVLEGTQWDLNELKHAGLAVSSDVASFLKNARSMAYQGYRKLLLGSNSLESMATWRSMKKFIGTFESLRKENPTAVTDNLEALRQWVLDNRTVRIGVSGNVKSLKRPVRDWQKNFIQFDDIKAKDLVPPGLSAERLSKLGHLPSKQVTIYASKNVSETCSFFATKVDIDNTSDELPALYVALSALHQPGGPFDRALKDTDFASAAGLWHDHDTGCIRLSLEDCPSPATALTAAKVVISDFVTRKTPVDDIVIDGALGFWAHWLTEVEDSPFHAAKVSFEDEVIYGRDQFFESKLLGEAKKKVTPTAVIAAMRKYILPVFSPDSSIGCVATSDKNALNVKAALAELGYDVTLEEVQIGQDAKSGSGSVKVAGDETDVDTKPNKPRKHRHHGEDQKEKKDKKDKKKKHSKKDKKDGVHTEHHHHHGGHHHRQKQAGQDGVNRAWDRSSM